MVQDDFTTEVQTDTRSLGSGLRGEERFEYLGFDVVLAADGVIADAEKNCPVQSLFYVYVVFVLDTISKICLKIAPAIFI